MFGKDERRGYQRGIFQSFGLEPHTITLMTTSLSWGVGIGVSINSTASMEGCTITCLGMMTNLMNRSR
jgi:hypothetical protein